MGEPVGAHPLAPRLASALRGESPLVALSGATAVDARDRLTALIDIYALHTAPLEVVGECARYQHHPVVAELKGALEADWLAELEAVPVPDDLPDDAVEAMRALAARDRLPAVYRWVAKQASYDELIRFLSLEGGPDGGFDDLVAACQVGLAGPAKLELATNYWDEMGNGDGGAVHTVLHQEMAAALGLVEVPVEQQPVEGLARTAMGGLLATNRWLQPEMIGALGLTELQAGPRCRLVLKAFDRLGAPRRAHEFYEVHADVDPRHGKDWLEKAVAPLVRERPAWAPRIVRGAWWRAVVNAAFFSAVSSWTADREAA
ncbi:MAG: iron-containing redox enzyme family protein [Frankiaceae bacterium]